MAPRKPVKENASEEVKTSRVLRPKLQIVPENNLDPENKMEGKVDKKKKATKTEGVASKAKKTATKSEPKAKAASKPKKVAAKGHKLPDPIKPGTVFTDSAKQLWKVGKSLGSGGFGEVYAATNNLNDKIDQFKYVMKVEYSTGPLFVEQNFYIRCAKPEHLEAWKKERKVKAIGLPTFYAMRGQQEHDGNSYRFIIITKFGEDLQHLLEEHKKFSLKNTLTIGCSLIDTLEYIHHSGYVHADLKPANILLGIDSSHAVVNIVDFGLATKYKDTDNNHKAHKEEKKAAHNGTLIYTSLVAHRGAVTTSRICDIEILAYNLLRFNTGSLPWTPHEKQPDKVMQMKQELLNDPAKFLATHYKEPVPDVFVDLFKYIAACEFEAEPGYDKLKQMFAKALTKSRQKMDGKLNFEETDDENAAAAATSAAAGKKKAPAAGGRGKKAAPKVVEPHSDEEEGVEDEHVDEGALRFVNTNKRRVKATVDKVEEAREGGEPVQEKRKRKNAKETKAAIDPTEPEPTPQPSSISLDETFTIGNPTPAVEPVLLKQQEKKPGPARNNKVSKHEKPKEKTRREAQDEELDENREMDTEPYPTPAMVDVMKKKEEKKTGRARNIRANKEKTNEKVDEDKPTKENVEEEEEEDDEMDTESNPTAAMVEITKKKLEKKPARNNRTTSKNEKVEDKLTKENVVEEEDDDEMDTESNPTPAMVEVMKKKLEKKPARNNRTTSKDEKVEDKHTKENVVEEDEMDTESNPTPAMVEVMKKKLEKKPARNNRTTSKDEKVDAKTKPDEINTIDTESYPTPAMMEVMKRKEEKRPARAYRTTSKDENVEGKTKYNESEEDNEMDTEAYPTPAMVEVMKKREEKKTARNYRTTSKDERVEEEEEEEKEEPLITKRRGKLFRVGENEDEEDLMIVEEEHEEPMRDRKQKRGAKEVPATASSVLNVNETFTLTPAMMEVINKKNERKAASKAKK